MSGRDRVEPSVYEAWAVLRVRQWIVFAPLPAAGIVHLDELQGARLWYIVGATIVSGLSLAYAYGLNAIFDRGSDEDPNKNVLAGRDRVSLVVVATVISTGLLALCGAIVLGRIALLAIAMSIAAGTIYSAGPRLKRFPGWGLFGNLMIFAPLMASALRPESIPPGFPTLFVVFALLVTQNQLMHEETDATEDAAAGVWTTARWFGPRRTRMAIGVLAFAIAWAAALAPTTLARLACVLIAGLSIFIAYCVERAKTRRLLHRYLSAIMGVVLFFVLMRA
jgi:4-hydroxybenzoate polyprenyltransferase